MPDGSRGQPVRVLEYEMSVELPPGLSGFNAKDLATWGDWGDGSLRSGAFISAINRAVPGYADHPKGIRGSGRAGGARRFRVRFLSSSAGLQSAAHAGRCAAALRSMYRTDAKVAVQVTPVAEWMLVKKAGVYVATKK